MPSITLTTENQEILSALDALTAEAYEGNLAERIKAYFKDKMLSEVNAYRLQLAKEAATSVDISPDEIT